MYSFDEVTFNVKLLKKYDDSQEKKLKLKCDRSMSTEIEDKCKICTCFDFSFLF